jgi:hypothetical protein
VLNWARELLSYQSSFYADDVIILCGAKIREVDVLMQCIEKFCC